MSSNNSLIAIISPPNYHIAHSEHVSSITLILWFRGSSEVFVGCQQGRCQFGCSDLEVIHLPRDITQRHQPANINHRIGLINWTTITTTTKSTEIRLYFVMSDQVGQGDKCRLLFGSEWGRHENHKNIWSLRQGQGRNENQADNTVAWNRSGRSRHGQRVGWRREWIWHWDPRRGVWAIQRCWGRGQVCC